jgi:hypothetical protein
MKGPRRFVSSISVSLATILTSSALAYESVTTGQSAAATSPVALYITLCLWSRERPAAMCREVPLTPGAAGPEFVSMEACLDGQEEAMRRWFSEAGPVFGFTDLAGDGYRIDGKHCRPVEGTSPSRE